MRTVLLLTLASALLADQPAVARRPDPRATAAVAAHNARRIGAPGWRRVTMELSDRGQVTRRFDVVNVWWRTGDRVDTVFVLEAPAGLRNTAYLQAERPGAATRELMVSLYLPTAGGRVLSLAPESLDEGLLDSDFTYGDLCWLLPASRDYTWKGEGRLLDEPTWIVETWRRPREDTRRHWVRALVQIGVRSHLVLGADYFDADGHRPAKSLRVKRARIVDGVWTAEEMRMTTAGGRSTSIRLLDARFGRIGLPAATAATLPELTRELAVAGLTRAAAGGAR